MPSKRKRPETWEARMSRAAHERAKEATEENDPYEDPQFWIASTIDTSKGRPTA